MYKYQLVFGTNKDIFVDSDLFYSQKYGTEEEARKAGVEEIMETINTAACDWKKEELNVIVSKCK